MLVIDMINGLGGLIDESANPKTATVIKAVNAAIDKNKQQLVNPEAWKAQRDIILLIMSKIPTLKPYSIVVAAIFEIVIQIVEIENVSAS